MKNKKGFTLIELLAVIVILGIIMSIAGMSVMSARKKSNVETAKKLEKTLKDLGAQIYTYEISSGNSGSGYFKTLYNGLKSIDGTPTDNNQRDSILISLSELKNNGYIKSNSIKNPNGGKGCYGFLRIYKTNTGPFFTSKIWCENLYSTNASTSSDAGCKKSGNPNDKKSNGELCDKWSSGYQVCSDTDNKTKVWSYGNTFDGKGLCAQLSS